MERNSPMGGVDAREAGGGFDTPTQLHVSQRPRNSVKVSMPPVLSSAAVEECFAKYGLVVPPNGLHVAGENGFNAVGMPEWAGVYVESELMLGALRNELNFLAVAEAVAKGAPTPRKVEVRSFHFKVTTRGQNKRNRSRTLNLICVPLFPGVGPITLHYIKALVVRVRRECQKRRVPVINVFLTCRTRANPVRSTTQYAQSITTFGLVLQTPEDAEKMVGVFDAFVDRPNLGDYSFYGLQRQCRSRPSTATRVGSSAPPHSTSSLATATATDWEEVEYIYSLCSAYGC